MNLANEMRPKSFSEYMGDGIRAQLVGRMKNEATYPHSILLYGTRGCGKTTAARLLAKEFLCMNKVDGHACGECEACQDIDENLIMSEAGKEVQGVTEVDITNDSTKRAIDSILEEAIEPPMWPLKYRILILDECHMADNKAQNRLLKIVEEPPQHLIIIFCTTNPEKMLPTLKDRCQLKVRVKKASKKELLDRMMKCCVEKGWKASERALNVILKKCDRNPRRCWNDLETLVTDYGKEVSIENVSKMYSGITDDVYFKYIDAAKSGVEEIMNFIADILEQDIELKEFMQDLTGFIMSCIEVKYGIGIEDNPPDFIKAVKSFFGEYSAQELDTLLQILEHANSLVAQSNGSDDELKLIISNTALRIGKVSLLSQGLQNEISRAHAENNRGYKIAVDRVNKTGKDVKVRGEELNNDLIQSVFGHNVLEIKPGDKMESSIPIVDDTSEDSEWSDEDLMNLLK